MENPHPLGWLSRVSAHCDGAADHAYDGISHEPIEL